MSIDFYITYDTHIQLGLNGYSIKQIGNQYIEGKACKIYSYYIDLNLGLCERINRLSLGIIGALFALGIPCCISSYCKNHWLKEPWNNYDEFIACVTDE